MVAAHVPTCAVDVSGLGHDLESAFGLEHLSQPATHHRMVVGDHNPDRLRPSGFRAFLGVGVAHEHQRTAAWSREPKYDARYLASIFAPGDHIGVSLTSELEPCPPVRWALKYRGFFPPSRMPWITGLNLCG